jgi:hypothetical protein
MMHPSFKNKITAEIAQKMRTTFWAGGITGKALASQFAVAPSTINRVLHRQIFGDLPLVINEPGNEIEVSK